MYSTALLVLASACVVFGQGAYYAAPSVAATTPVPIIAQAQEINPDGSYRYSYQTGNGISAGEAGALKNAGTQNEGIAAQGAYSYTGPDGVVYQVEYYSDAENGFVARGAHLPTPPPLPEALVRANELAYKNAAAFPDTEPQYSEKPVAYQAAAAFPKAYPTALPAAYPTAAFPAAYPKAYPTAFPAAYPTAFPAAYPTAFPAPTNVFGRRY